MFEKSLYDLIRGVRNHKGTETDYIKESLRECRKEIKSQDMDVKATALLKLIYLEMFGHDMSWASFNVLEVMSSPKYLQKRVGYLGAVQTFRPDTEVLMLAENLLKKDLSSPLPTTISLPLVAIPHVVSPSMANSLLSDLLPRLSHSHASIRKKTVATLYRLALAYPETLRPAWPKMKERLLDVNEEQSVTAAIVNVVCELGWRRPQDFLPLAPRLFDLLVEGGNNWMAIKIIKLFATLTPLEPRLVKKLLPPLTSIIKTTPAMSLLYECIHGIIQGGILDGSEGVVEGEEIARLCVGKLRGMLVVGGDPNLKYVALLAFNKIVASHPHLVALHQDVILECIDDPDISIRTRALDLIVGMVNGDNIESIVERLMRQLRTAPLSSSDDPLNERSMHSGVTPAADSDEEDPAEPLKPGEKEASDGPLLPDDYRVNVIRKILDMCSRGTYANINDFEWYIDVLIQLVKCSAVTAGNRIAGPVSDLSDDASEIHENDVSYSVGAELLNVAVRVKDVRADATRAAETLLSGRIHDTVFPGVGGGQSALESAAWIVGEFAEYLLDPDATLNSLVHPSTAHLPAWILCPYIQAIPKVLVRLTSNERISWTAERKTLVSLILARALNFLEPLTTHPSLEIQERAVEYAELVRLAVEAASSHDAGNTYDRFVEPPLLLTQALPLLFKGSELNPVAPGAQKKVPVPAALDLEKPINEDLYSILQLSDAEERIESGNDDFTRFYYAKAELSTLPEPAANRLDAQKAEATSSYQSADANGLGGETLARRKAELAERYRDDPFYIGAERRSGTSTPIHNILKSSNGEELDIDSIPIMDLGLDSKASDTAEGRDRDQRNSRSKVKARRKITIAPDETIGGNDESLTSETERSTSARVRETKARKNLLQVDSSGLGTLSLDADGPAQLDVEKRAREEAEMAQAMKEVERLRLEMQRASERIQPRDVPAEGTLVKRRRKKKEREKEKEMSVLGGVEEEEKGAEGSGDAAGGEMKRKKKNRKEKEEGQEGVQGLKGEVQVVKPKKKKKRKVAFKLEEPNAEA